MRGLILPQPLAGGPTSIHTKMINLDFQKCVTYWDYFSRPTNNAVGLAFSPEEEFLKEAGLFKEVHITVLGKTLINADLFQQTQLKAQSLLNQSNYTNWSILQDVEGSTPSQARVRNPNTFSLEIINKIPAPPPGTPLDDILEFKEKRQSELHAFHSRIDELFHAFLVSGGDQTAMNAALGIIDNDLKTLEICQKEKWARPSLSSSGFSFPIIPSVIAAITLDPNFLVGALANSFTVNLTRKKMSTDDYPTYLEVVDLVNRDFRS